MKTLVAAALLFTFSSAWAVTPGLVGNSNLIKNSDGTVSFRLTWSAATEIYDFLSEARETTDGKATQREGRAIKCTRTIEGGDTRHQCVFSLDKEGEVAFDKDIATDAVPSVNAFFSIWPKKGPQPLVKLKFSSDVARLLIKEMVPLEEGKRIINKNKIRCGVYVSRHGRIGALSGLAPRCFVGFTASGESVLAEALP